MTINKKIISWYEDQKTLIEIAFSSLIEDERRKLEKKKEEARLARNKMRRARTASSQLSARYAREEEKILADKMEKDFRSFRKEQEKQKDQSLERLDAIFLFDGSTLLEE